MSAVDNGINKKVFDELWAVDAGRIREFFTELGDTAADVSVIALPERKVGMLAFPQTRVIIVGEGAEEVYRQFSLRFMSAGG